MLVLVRGWWGGGGRGAPWKQQITGEEPDRLPLLSPHPSCLMSWLLVSLRNLNQERGAKF